MIRRVLIASALIVGSAAVAPSAFAADTEKVPFGATIVTSCSFPGSPGAGTLGNPLPNTLSSFLADGGTKGTAVVRCNSGSGNLSITGVTQTAGPNLTNPVYTATAIGVSTGAVYGPGTTLPGGIFPVVLSGVNIPLDVNMTVTTSGELTAGTYGFTVDLTVTP